MTADEDRDLPPPPPELVNLPPPLPCGHEGDGNDEQLEPPPALEPWGGPPVSVKTAQDSSSSPSPPLDLPLQEGSYPESGTKNSNLPVTETAMTPHHTPHLASVPHQPALPPLMSAPDVSGDVAQDLDVSGTGDEGMELQYARPVTVVTDDQTIQVRGGGGGGASCSFLH